jgi:opacity protein-like surface antigen
MKKHLTLLTAFLASGLLSAPAFAATHYISALGGISWMNNIDRAYGPKMTTDSGGTVVGAVGCDYGSYRFEAEAGYQTNNVDSSVSILSLMANGYYDMKVDGVTPYLMAGVGVAQAHFDNVYSYYDASRISDNETALAFQAGAGVAIPIAKQVMLDARYRYFSTSDFSSYLTGNTHISSNSALLGLRVNF